MDIKDVPKKLLREIQAQAIDDLIDARYPEGYNETDKISVKFMLCRINHLHQQAKDTEQRPNKS